VFEMVTPKNKSLFKTITEGPEISDSVVDGGCICIGTVIG
jgi:hypothetical protein